MDLQITLPRTSVDSSNCNLMILRAKLNGTPESGAPQPAQWISATRIRSHPGPSQRPFTPTKYKCEAAPLGPRPARVYSWPGVMCLGWPVSVAWGNSNRREGRRAWPTQKDQHGLTHSGHMMTSTMTELIGTKKHLEDITTSSKGYPCL